jgi:hypothetical protein
MNAVSRLLLAACAGVVAHMPAASADPNAGKQAQPPSQSSPVATVQVDANKPVQKVLVDDTVNDAQLKQILAKGYKPESQARDHEVYYCRRERQLGTLIQTKICKTSRQILQDELDGKEETTRLERIGGSLQ